MADNLEQIANDLNTASLNLQELRGKYEGALDVLNAKNEQIIEALDSKKEEALQEVKGAKDTATTEITNLQDTALSKIDESKNTSITELTNKKTEALAKIEEAKTEQGEKIAKLETELNLKAKLLTQNLAWTVGSGEETDTHFNTLQKALNKACHYRNLSNVRIDIKLKSDYDFNENISLNYVDLRFVIISSENTEVQVDENLTGHAFSCSNSHLPIINTIFNCDGNEKLTMFFALTNSVLFINREKGVKNCKGVVIQGFNNWVYCSGSIFTGCKGEYCFRVWSSNVMADNADFSNFTGGVLIHSFTGAYVTATNAKYTNCHPTNTLLSVAYFGIIVSYANEKTGLQGTATNITPNQFNAAGIIDYN